MPLKTGCDAVGENIREMQESGHKRNQAIAAALEMKRRTCKSGGRMEKHRGKKKKGGKRGGKRGGKKDEGRY